MSNIIIHTNNRNVALNLNRLEHGDNSTGHIPHPELFEGAYDLNFSGGLGSNRKGTIKVMKNNGIVWVYISELVARHGGDELNIFIAEPYSDAFIPKEFIEGAKKLTGRKNLSKAMGMTKEELEKYYVNEKLNMVTTDDEN